MSKLKNIIAGGILLAGAIFSPVYAKDKDLETIVGSAPHFSEVNDNDCAKYVRLAAHEISGAKYNPASAWNFSKSNRLVTKIEGDIKKYENLLVPGRTSISFFNPHSPYRFEKVDGKKTGKLRNVTHVALYAGKENGEIILFEDSGELQRKTTFSHLVKDNGYIPKEIIEPKIAVEIKEDGFDLSYDTATADHLKKYAPIMEGEASSYKKRFNICIDPNRFKTHFILEARNDEYSLEHNQMHPTDEMIKILANGEEGAYLIGNFDYLKGKKVKDLTPEENIRAAVAIFYLKMAEFDKKTVESGDLINYTIQKNDSADIIRKKYGTTLETIRKYTPSSRIKAIAKVNPGDVLTFKKAKEEYFIRGWRSVPDSVERYNGGGDSNYPKKANIVYKHFTGGRIN